MSDPKLNETVTEALSELLEVDGGYVKWKPWPNPITHGYFNRRMFLEAFLMVGGTGVAIEKDSIIEYAGITEKEFNPIANEYISKGVIRKEENIFGVEMYKLNMKEGNIQATP